MEVKTVKTRKSMELFDFVKIWGHSGCLKEANPKKNNFVTTFLNANNLVPTESFGHFHCAAILSHCWLCDGHRNVWILTLFVPVQRGYPSSHFKPILHPDHLVIGFLMGAETFAFWPYIYMSQWQQIFTDFEHPFSHDHVSDLEGTFLKIPNPGINNLVCSNFRKRTQVNSNAGSQAIFVQSG